ncbi:hypothetical protein AJ88_43165 [Mesorhizobium amorphae CCBAU 01583]|nr:hypothetical protein AJ88_43165 [Mesorhizobium amorphae CCBAU 01583]
MALNTEMGTLPRSSMPLIIHVLWSDKLNEIIVIVAHRIIKDRAVCRRFGGLTMLSRELLDRIESFSQLLTVR